MKKHHYPHSDSSCTDLDDDTTCWCNKNRGGRACYATESEANNYIASYAIDRESGALNCAGTQPTKLPGSPHCVVDPTGSMLVSSQMAGGGATSFPLSGGVLQPPKTVMPFGEHHHWR